MLLTAGSKSTPNRHLSTQAWAQHFAGAVAAGCSSDRVAHDQDPGVGRLFLQSSSDRQSIDDRHTDIENDEIGVE